MHVSGIRQRRRFHKEKHIKVRGLHCHNETRTRMKSVPSLVLLPHLTMASDPESNALPTDSGRRRHHHNQSSPTDLFSSASLLAGSARSAFSHDGAALDKAKLSEAGENLIAAASEYGKLEERGYGSYIEKAETYLHQLHSSPEKKPTDHSPATEKATEAPHGEKKAPEEHHSGGGFGGFGGGGFGDYMKVAEGFLKK